MATVFHDTSADHKWSTAGNWSDGVPDASDAVTIDSDVTSLIIDGSTCACLSFNATGTAGITISGSAELRPYGAFTLDANVTWTHSGSIRCYTNTCNITTSGVALSTSSDLRALSGATISLQDDLTIIRAVYIQASTFVTNNHTVNIGIFSDNGVAGATTLTLGSSTINCTNVSFGTCTLTVTSTDHTINIVSTANIDSYFGGKSWGTIAVTMTGNGIGQRIYGTNTFVNYSINWPTAHTGNYLKFGANQVISGTLTITGSSTIARPYVSSDTPGTQRTVQADVVTVTGAVDFQDINGTGDGSWDLSAVNSGNFGGNSGLTFRTPATYYCCCGTTNAKNWTDDVWSTTDDGSANGTTVFPLPQDTAIINDNTWGDTGNTLNNQYEGRMCKIDASGLSEANTLTFNRAVGCYGDMILTGAGLTVTSSVVITIDARVRNEDGGDTLDINILPSFGAGSITVNNLAGTTKLLTNNLTLTGTFTLTRGTFDLATKTLTCAIFSSSSAVTRTLQDTGTGGKIVITGTGSTVDVFTIDTATNLTVSNAPDLQFGTSVETLTADCHIHLNSVNAYTFGDLAFKKYAGNFTRILSGINHTFGDVTQETPDAV